MKVLVLGAGVSGKAAARLARRLGYDVEVYDERAAAVTPLMMKSFTVHSGSWTSRLLRDIDLVVASPGIPEHALPIRDSLRTGLPLWSELEFAARRLEAPYVAVTGTNGKTTTASAAAQMLARSGLRATAAGNIGTALSDVVDDTWDVLVIEASSFQLRFTETFHPLAAAILNIAPDHLDWHGSYEAYVAAKAAITANQESGDLLVYNADDEDATRIALTSAARLQPIVTDASGDAGWGPDGARLALGDHMVALPDVPTGLALDLTAAAALALDRGGTLEAIGNVVEGFEPPDHRHRTVGVWDGVTWINDSKATNPHAAVAAAAAHDSVVLIAGGRNKGLDLAPLATVESVRLILAIGEAAAELLEAAPGRTRVVDTMDDAVKAADEAAQPGDTVLLAPGCASFDMFDSYEHRGREFVRLVRAEKGEL